MIACHKKEIPHDLSQAPKVMSTLFIFIGIGTVTHWFMRALDKLGGRA